MAALVQGLGDEHTPSILYPDAFGIGAMELARASHPSCLWLLHSYFPGANLQDLLRGCFPHNLLCDLASHCYAA